MAYKRGRSRSRSRPIKRRRTGSTYRRRVKRSTKSRMYKTLGQPKYRKVIMPYNDVLDIVNGAGTSTVYIYRANSIFDPDFAFGGHQPLSHDQWAFFYNHYIVLSCNITVNVLPGTTAVNYPLRWGIALQDDTTTHSANTYIENKHSQHRTVNFHGNGRKSSIKFHANMLKFLGRKLGSDDIKATFGANPAEGAFWHLYFENLDVANLSPGFRVEVNLSYTCLLIEPKALPQS